MKKILIFLIFGFIVYFWFNLNSNKAILQKVVDGDTLIVKENGKEVKLRLIGIDTIEYYKSSKLKREAKKCNISTSKMSLLGKESTNFAKSYFREGDEVKYTSYGTDRYGRVLAWIDSNDYNFEVVKRGYGLVFSKSTQLPDSIMNKLYDYEEDAKNNEEGHWESNRELMLCLSGGRE